MHELYVTKADASYNLHATLGHMPYSRIERMVRRGIWSGYNFDRKFLKDMLNVRCDICLCAKMLMRLTLVTCTEQLDREEHFHLM